VVSVDKIKLPMLDIFIFYQIYAEIETAKNWLSNE